MSDLLEARLDRIVVGLDGSECAARALRWAADEAGVRGSELHIVTAFAPPDVVGVPGARFPVERPEQTRERAQRLQSKWLSEALGDDYPDVAMLTEVRMGQSAETLLEAAKNGDMLVVGSRGRGGFKGLMLGSVSMQCVTHAEGPVTVIP
ncbi:MAG: universal stress protein [Acidimicrobiia bacterium]